MTRPFSLDPLARVLLAVSLLTGSAMALAQNAASAPPAAAAPSPAKKALIDKVLKLQQPGIEALGAQIANQTAGQILQAAGQALGRVPPEKREAVARDMQAEVKKFYDDVAPTLRDRAVKLAPETVGADLDKNFNEEELRVLIAWLESPVQRKYQQASAEMSQSLARRVVSESQTAVAPKLKTLEQSITGKLNAAAGTPSGAASAARPTSPAKK